MSNYLFLDDNEDRTNLILAEYRKPKNQYIYFQACKTAKECIRLLQDVPHWDIVSLDHDLGNEVFVDSDRIDSGMEVVRWILINKPKVDAFIIHSWNPPAAHEMAVKLRDAEYSCIQMPFSSVTY